MRSFGGLKINRQANRKTLFSGFFKSLVPYGWGRPAALSLRGLVVESPAQTDNISLIFGSRELALVETTVIHRAMRRSHIFAVVKNMLVFINTYYTSTSEGLLCLVICPNFQPKVSQQN